ncbi:uncharacterized protein PHACADRAFT_251379 [Phanerochaete carnosa HHB-10118-sp]|uniref:Uncharacterized protein n=1 Tax=Phanerochaete carnosa (strain HHB-10118-sp) TaxID=650164 RepID=K5X480_PHACS|nr:uncharacterized protein PHACADRAFT_251379 [Phanerochaete carnosa HHB-10118-sp]EKM57642.1 hypothetical protein PHACADRAFT_251379 [Phanerochaete carnosa HHB-10118-sp]
MGSLQESCRPYQLPASSHLPIDTPRGSEPYQAATNVQQWFHFMPHKSRESVAVQSHAIRSAGRGRGTEPRQRRTSVHFQELDNFATSLTCRSISPNVVPKDICELRLTVIQIRAPSPWIAWRATVRKYFVDRHKLVGRLLSDSKERAPLHSRVMYLQMKERIGRLPGALRPR